MSRRLLSLIGFLAVAAAIVVVVSVTTGNDSGKSKNSKDDPQPNNPRFHTRAVADHYGGPVPLTVRFNVKPFNIHGQVQYRFHFDDGTASTVKSPVHTFTKPGYYQVLMDARDDTGDNDRWNLVIGAWPPTVWGNTKPQDIPKQQAAQKTRSDLRRVQSDRQLATRLAGF